MRVLAPVLALLLHPLAVAAEPTATAPKDVRQMVTDDCAKARRAGKDCVLSIEAHEVGGRTPTAGGTVITGRPDTKHGSLIRIRRDFIQEILKTAEDL